MLAKRASLRHGDGYREQICIASPGGMLRSQKHRPPYSEVASENFEVSAGSAPTEMSLGTCIGTCKHDIHFKLTFIERVPDPKVSYNLHTKVKGLNMIEAL